MPYCVSGFHRDYRWFFVLLQAELFSRLFPLWMGAKLICPSWEQSLGKRRDSGKALNRWCKGFSYSLWVMLLTQEVVYSMKREVNVSSSIATLELSSLCVCVDGTIWNWWLLQVFFKDARLAAAKLSLYPKQTPSLFFSFWGNMVWKIVWGSLFSKLGCRFCWSFCQILETTSLKVV